MIRVFKDKRSQKEVAERIRNAIGMKKGLRITEDFARWFFEEELRTAEETNRDAKSSSHYRFQSRAA